MLNFTVWDHLLGQYVDDRGRVDYRTWKTEAQTDLSTWLDQMGQTPLPADEDEQLAYWINVYNAAVVAEVLKRYPIASIRPTLAGIPNWLAFLRFFQRPVFYRNDRPYSLNDIEHGTIRKTFRQPRIHFALVCAAIGCPLLRNEAYQPDRVQEQLEADADRFINNPDKVRYEPTQNTLYCSKIFQWYGKDFLSSAASVPAFIQPYLRPSPAVADTLTVHYLPYDWSLNQRQC